MELKYIKFPRAPFEVALELSKNIKDFKTKEMELVFVKLIEQALIPTTIVKKESQNDR